MLLQFANDPVSACWCWLVTTRSCRVPRRAYPESRGVFEPRGRNQRLRDGVVAAAR
jgi:hypothetical protein